MYVLNFDLTQKPKVIFGLFSFKIDWNDLSDKQKMDRHIRIEFSAISSFYLEDSTLDLKARIQQKKLAIYSHRLQQLSKYVGHPILASDIMSSKHGKPYLSADFPCYFNHSHSHQYYALAMSKKIKDLGVDVEDLDRKVRFEALAKHAFHPNELKTWQSLSFDSSYWFKVWTTKEAILKAHGMGIRMNLNELDTQVHADFDGGVCTHSDLGVFAYQNFQIGHSVLAIAWRSELSCRGFAYPTIEIIQ